MEEEHATVSTIMNRKNKLEVAQRADSATVDRKTQFNRIFAANMTTIRYLCSTARTNRAVFYQQISDDLSCSRFLIDMMGLVYPFS
jgi:hypothetical protein